MCLYTENTLIYIYIQSMMCIYADAPWEVHLGTWKHVAPCDSEIAIFLLLRREITTWTKHGIFSFFFLEHFLNRWKLKLKSWFGNLAVGFLNRTTWWLEDFPSKCRVRPLKTKFFFLRMAGEDSLWLRMLWKWAERIHENHRSNGTKWEICGWTKRVEIVAAGCWKHPAGCLAVLVYFAVTNNEISSNPLEISCDTGDLQGVFVWKRHIVLTCSLIG